MGEIHLRGLALCALLALALSGCPKSEEKKPAPEATPAPVAAVDAGSSDAAAAAATPDNASSSFAGTYSVEPAQYYIPKSNDWSNVKQVKDDPEKHVGEGTLTVLVAPDGRVSGKVESGPASPAVLDGRLVDGELRATVRREDPTDDGLTGTLLGKIAGDAVDGQLSLAESNAAIVRAGKLSLKKK